MRALIIACLVVVAGCAPPKRRSTVPLPPEATAPDHPDWTRLKLLRNYLRLERVEPFGHHFTIWYHHEEPGVCEALVENGRVALHHCFVGGVTPRPEHPTPIAPELTPLADAVWRRVREHNPGATNPLVQYDGEYREVTFGEVIPTVEHRPAGMRTTLSLASDASVTRFLRVVSETSGYGALCGGLDDVYCSITPRWIHFDAPPRGESLLIAMRAKVKRGSIDGDPLAAALLDEAHRAMRGEPPLPLDSLPVGDTLLPNGLEQRVQLYVEVHAWHPGRDSEDEMVRLLLPLDARDLARGDAHAEGHVVLAGVGFDASVVMRGDPVAASGDAARETTIRIHDSRGDAFGWIFPATAHLLVDGERAAATSVAIQNPGATYPKQELHGAGDVASFTVLLHDDLRPAWRDNP
jgi:hypothetical protein